MTESYTDMEQDQDKTRQNKTIALLVCSLGHGWIGVKVRGFVWGSIFGILYLSEKGGR